MMTSATASATSLVQVMGRCTLVLLLALVVAPAAHAQTPEADTATARALAKDAFAAYDAGDFAKAAELFDRAGVLHSAPTLLLGLARSQVKLGRFVEARENYQKIIVRPLPAGASDAFVRAHADAKIERKALDAKIAWVTIVVEGSSVPEVTLDGAAISTASLAVKRAVNPGEHRLTAQEGGSRDETTFVIAAGETTEVKLQLEPQADPGAVEPAPAPAPTGTATPAPSSSSPSSSGGDGAEGGGTQRVLGYLSLGLGGAGLMVGAITGGIAMGQHSDLSEVCPNEQCPMSQEADLDAYNTTTTVSTVGFVAGGVLAAAGLVLVLTAPGGEADEASAARAEITVGPAQVNARLRF